MLVVSRHIGEVIRIGDNIRIMVCNIEPKRNQVRIGIQAPPEIKILREELVERDLENSNKRGEE